MNPREHLQLSRAREVVTTDSRPSATSKASRRPTGEGSPTSLAPRVCLGKCMWYMILPQALHHHRFHIEFVLFDERDQPVGAEGGQPDRTHGSL